MWSFALAGEVLTETTAVTLTAKSAIISKGERSRAATMFAVSAVNLDPGMPSMRMSVINPFRLFGIGLARLLHVAAGSLNRTIVVGKRCNGYS